MSAPLFTPGPWSVQHERDGDCAIWAREPFTHLLANVIEDDEDIPTNVAANANVMAAGPALYWAAWDARDFLLMAEGADDPEVREAAAIALRSLDSALAKARGEANTGQDIAPQNGGGM